MALVFSEETKASHVPGRIWLRQDLNECAVRKEFTALHHGMSNRIGQWRHLKGGRLVVAFLASRVVLRCRNSRVVVWSTERPV